MLGAGAAFAFLGLLFLSFVACFSGTLGYRLRTGPGLSSALRYLTGGVLIGLGLAFPQRR
jgi:threonine/homoserine/homoserine lactone efflux protein